MAQFSGTLNTNVWHNTLFNAYLLVKTISNTLAIDNTYAARFREDADLYHDKFVYTDYNRLNVRDYDINDTNVLAKEQIGEIKQQEIVVTEAKQIGFTSGPWLKKAAWQSEGSYNEFQSNLDATVDETRRMYEMQLMNVYLGAVLESSVGIQSKFIELPTVADNPEAEARIQAQTIALNIANYFDELKDPATDNNDNGFWHSYNPDDFYVVFNTQYRNKILKIDLPTIFDNAGLKSDFAGDALLAKYFGKLTAATVKTTGVSNTTIRAVDEMDVTDTSSVKHHVKPGQLMPNNVTISDGTTISIPTYTVDSKIICKIVHKDGIKFLNAMETSTEFFNAKNLSTNRYATFAFALPAYLAAYPLITVREA
mgnify:CR=1 FL=1